MNADKGRITGTELTYNIKANPVYGLSVKADQGEERVATPGAAIGFTVSYSMEHITQAEIIQVEVRRKEDGAYIEADGWEVSGDLDLGQGDGAKREGNAAVTITVPENTGEGTYRLIFKLGDKKALYNIIIRSCD